MIIHHSASPKEWTTVYDIDRWHKNRGFYVSEKGYHVGYHYVIEEDKLKQTRNLHETGAHTKGFNDQIGICLAGDFTYQEPSIYQKIKLFKLIMETDEDISVHRDYSKTDCPGNNLIRIIKRLVKLKKVINKLKKYAIR